MDSTIQQLATSRSEESNLLPCLTCNIGAEIITNTMLGVPCRYNYGIMGPETLLMRRKACSGAVLPGLGSKLPLKRIHSSELNVQGLVWVYLV